jgi:hypothetical protein
MMEEPPGPPLSQIARGAVEGFLRASKNQKNLLSSVYRKDNEELILGLRVDRIVLRLADDMIQKSGREVDVAGVRLYSGRQLAYSRL